jgi:hypothetical protein
MMTAHAAITAVEATSIPIWHHHVGGDGLAHVVFVALTLRQGHAGALNFHIRHLV